MKKIHFKNKKDETENIENEDEKTTIAEEYIEVFSLIPYFPVSAEYLAGKTNLKISQINQQLTMLELEGYIKSMPGNNYVRI